MDSFPKATVRAEAEKAITAVFNLFGVERSLPKKATVVEILSDHLQAVLPLLKIELSSSATLEETFRAVQKKALTNQPALGDSLSPSLAANGDTYETCKILMVIILEMTVSLAKNDLEFLFKKLDDDGAEFPDMFEKLLQALNDNCEVTEAIWSDILCEKDKVQNEVQYDSRGRPRSPARSRLSKARTTPKTLSFSPHSEISPGNKMISSFNSPILREKRREREAKLNAIKIIELEDEMREYVLENQRIASRLDIEIEKNVQLETAAASMRVDIEAKELALRDRFSEITALTKQNNDLERLIQALRHDNAILSRQLENTQSVLEAETQRANMIKEEHTILLKKLHDAEDLLAAAENKEKKLQKKCNDTEQSLKELSAEFAETTNMLRLAKAEKQRIEQEHIFKIDTTESGVSLLAESTLMNLKEKLRLAEEENARLVRCAATTDSDSNLLLSLQKKLDFLEAQHVELTQLVDNYKSQQQSESQHSENPASAAVSVLQYLEGLQSASEAIEYGRKQRPLASADLLSRDDIELLSIPPLKISLRSLQT